MSLAQLQTLKVVKSLLLGSRSQGVWLLEKNVVKKRYDARSPAQLRRFEKEVAVLTRLQGCPYAPTLYVIDRSEYAIYMSYCGSNPKPIQRPVKRAVKAALKEFGQKYQVFRVKDGKERYSYRHLFPANICQDKTSGQVRLIDFGSSLWQIRHRVRNPRTKPNR